MANTQIIYIDAPIFAFANSEVSEFGDVTITSFDTDNSGTIGASVVFSVDQNLDRFITFVSPDISGVSNELISEYQDNVIGETVFYFPDFQETVVSANAQVLPVIGIQSIESTLTFGDEEQFKLNLSIVDQGVASTLVFGTANAFVSIGATSVESTIAFGLPVKQNPVHRSLIYKNDNITKLGREDDVEIASGIVIQTSTAKLTGNTVPGSAAGYIKVTIDGTDYSMPFFEIPEQ